MLWSKVAGTEMYGWRDIFSTVLSRHSGRASFEFLDKGEFVQVLNYSKGIAIFWPRCYDPSSLKEMFDEIYGYDGCIYELPGLVEVCPGDWVLDGGACEGFFSLYCLSKGANVVAVEPNPYMAAALRLTLQPYLESGRAMLVEACLGAKSGETRLRCDAERPGDSCEAPLGALDDAVPVSVFTLDELILTREVAPRLDYLKLDVEGAERTVLDGAAGTLRRFHPKCALACYHFPDDHKLLALKLKASVPEYQLITRGIAHVNPGTPFAGRPWLRPKALFAWPVHPWEG